MTRPLPSKISLAVGSSIELDVVGGDTDGVLPTLMLELFSSGPAGTTQGRFPGRGMAVASAPGDGVDDKDDDEDRDVETVEAARNGL